MNKNLNNWLDEAEGLPKDTTNNNIEKEKARQGVKVDRKEVKKIDILSENIGDNHY